ncbi:FAD-dependent oxidoreductase [Deinococcus fonticola]|uniref:FAD-dependent oxidoreductase n=1 Tax=Deinococcus fonticola TaxID=2528713 RepID=UPI001074D008|nr:FAD-dependent oxidoreductase [Deinococcus fonticola]
MNPGPSREAEVVVVGGGLIGACVAFTLRQAGYAVTVLDADLPGAAWRAGAGLLSPDAEGLTPGTPLGVCAAESLRQWPDFARQLEGASGQSVHYREGVRRRQPDGTWAVTPGEAQLHPPSVVRAARQGLPLHPERVLHVQSRAGRVLLNTDQGTWHARAVVLAAGAWSAAFGLPVTPVQGQALLLALDGSADAAAYAGRRRGSGARAYTLTRPDGVYVGATVRHSASVQPDPQARRWLLAAAGRFGLDGASGASTLVGLRPGTPDSRPIVAPHPAHAGVVVATGHGRHGALLAPWTARRVLGLVERALAGSARPTRGSMPVAQGAR